MTAIDRARSECMKRNKGNKCDVQFVFSNKCGAIAQSGNSNYVNSGNSEGQAAAAAMLACFKDKRENCVLKVGFCSWRDKLQGEAD